MSFLDKGYKVPKPQSNYKRFEAGDNTFRIVSSAVVGYEYWRLNPETGKDEPVRSREAFDVIPSDIKADSDIKHFWAFVIIDRWDGKIKILELTQTSIMKPIKKLVDSKDWGDPKGYDITINKTGEKLNSEYTVQPSPHKELTAEEKSLIEKTKVNLDALFTGEDPFTSDKIAEVK